jgi:hypothetical protein
MFLGKNYPENIFSIFRHRDFGFGTIKSKSEYIGFRKVLFKKNKSFEMADF